MENSLKSFVDSSNSVLVLLPNNPKFDEVAGALAFYLAFTPQKPVLVVSPTEMTVAFNRLVGVNKITKEFGNKNLTIRFVNYNPEGIDKVSYDIENGEFRLTVAPKAGVAAPDEDKIQISYAGASADTVILIGGVNESDFPLIRGEDLAGAKIIHLGTRALESSGKVISLARPASCLSELMATLIKESGLSFNADIATNLLMGVEEATQGFKDPDVTAETFALVAELMRQGGRRMPKESPEVGTRTFAEPNPKAPKSWLEPKIYKGTSIS